jgi:hypothetical protein
VRAEADLQGYLVYDPVLVGTARLRFPHTKSRQTHTEEVAYLLPLEDGGVEWSEGKVQLEADELESTPEREAHFAELPAELGAAKRLTALKKEFADHLYYNSSVILWYNPHLKLYSKVDETAKAFQRRCRQAAEEALEDEAEKLQDRYRQDKRRLQDRLQREKRELEEDKDEHSARKQEELFSGVESVFGLITGSRSSRRLSSASRKRRMTRQARADVKESEEAIEDLEELLEELEAEEKRELEELAAEWGELIDDVEEIEVRPRRTDVQIRLFGLAWVPRWEVTVAGQALSMSAIDVERI